MQSELSGEVTRMYITERIFPSRKSRTRATRSTSSSLEVTSSSFSSRILLPWTCAHVALRLTTVRQYRSDFPRINPTERSRAVATIYCVIAGEGSYDLRSRCIINCADPERRAIIFISTTGSINALRARVFRLYERIYPSRRKL